MLTKIMSMNLEELITANSIVSKRIENSYSKVKEPAQFYDFLTHVVEAYKVGVPSVYKKNASDTAIIMMSEQLAKLKETYQFKRDE